jgi:hypothetical protein
MKITHKLQTLFAVFLLASIFSVNAIAGGIISKYEIKNASTIEEGVEKIIESVNKYGLEEYNEQVEKGVKQPYFWLLKPLNLQADNPVDMFAPDFTKGIKKGACFAKLFHENMQAGMSVEDAKKDAKKHTGECLKNGESPLEGKFASNVRQMVLCHAKHGQILLNKPNSLKFAAYMPCHISIYKKNGKVFVSWRNISKLAKQTSLNDRKIELAKEIQKGMKAMLSNLK